MLPEYQYSGLFSWVNLEIVRIIFEISGVGPKYPRMWIVTKFKCSMELEGAGYVQKFCFFEPLLSSYSMIPMKSHVPFQLTFYKKYFFSLEFFFNPFLLFDYIWNVIRLTFLTESNKQTNDIYLEFLKLFYDELNN